MSVKHEFSTTTPETECKCVCDGTIQYARLIIRKLAFRNYPVYFLLFIRLTEQIAFLHSYHSELKEKMQAFLHRRYLKIKKGIEDFMSYIIN